CVCVCAHINVQSPVKMEHPGFLISSFSASQPAHPQVSESLCALYDRCVCVCVSDPYILSLCSFFCFYPLRRRSPACSFLILSCPNVNCMCVCVCVCLCIDWIYVCVYSVL